MGLPCPPTPPAAGTRGCRAAALAPGPGRQGRSRPRAARSRRRCARAARAAAAGSRARGCRPAARRACRRRSSCCPRAGAGAGRPSSLRTVQQSIRPGVALPRSMSSQRRWACIAITARFSCSVNGRGETVRPVVTMGVSARVSGLGFGTFSSSSGGITFLADSSSSTPSFTLSWQAWRFLSASRRRTRFRLGKIPNTSKKRSSRGARVVPARCGAVRWPGRAETAAAAAACQASPRRRTAASHPRDR